MPDDSSRARHISVALLVLLVLPICGWTSTIAKSNHDLSRDPAWIRLGHYEPQRSSASGLRSAIHSPEFFLSPKGRDDPEAELLATLDALKSPKANEADGTAARCRFPARRAWLQRSHPELADIPSGPCPEYEKWTHDNSVRSISLVFATGYLNNPASFYGHTLLKLNFDERLPASRLMDESVNFGAIVEGASDPVSYMIKGVVGGYDGGFSHTNYYFHENNYGEIELRDLWEYRLDLPKEAVDLIVAHTWEVLGKRYVYYFLRRNCAFRIAELIQILEGVEIIPPRRGWTIPQSLIQHLAKADYQGKPLVSEVRYTPSRQSRLYGSFSRLDRTERRLVRSLAIQNASLDDHDFTDRELKSQHAMLDTLLDYYQYVRDAESRSNGEQDPRYVAALAKRYELPPGDAPETLPHSPASPASARSPGFVQVGAVHRADGESGALLRVRAAYYDALDAEGGHVANASLVMGDVLAHVDKRGLDLRRLDFLSLESANPGLTGLPGDRGKAWRIRIGAEAARLECRHCLVARIQGHIGIAHAWGNRLFGSAYVGASLQERKQGTGPVLGRGTVTLVAKPFEGVGIVVSQEYRASLRNKDKNYGATTAELRWSVCRDNDIRIRLQHEDRSEVSVAFGSYW